MVITPALRGMFGLDADAQSNAIRLDPHLPADWNEAEVDKLHVGAASCSLKYERQGEALVVHSEDETCVGVRLVSDVKGARIATDGRSVTFALPAVEVAVPHGLPLPGARTTELKVLAETTDAHSLTLELESAQSSAELKVRGNRAKLDIRAEGATLAPLDHSVGEYSLLVKFPSGEGYQHKTVTLRW
jgi:hypothetical protein